MAPAHSPNLAAGVTAHKSTGGGGYGRPDSAGVSPINTRKNKKPLSFSKNPEKEKRPPNGSLERLGMWEKSKKVIKKLFDNASVKVYNNNTGNTCW